MADYWVFPVHRLIGEQRLSALEVAIFVAAAVDFAVAVAVAEVVDDFSG